MSYLQGNYHELVILNCLLINIFKVIRFYSAKLKLSGNTFERLVHFSFIPFWNKKSVSNLFQFSIGSLSFAHYF